MLSLIGESSFFVDGVNKLFVEIVVSLVSVFGSPPVVLIDEGRGVNCLFKTMFVDFSDFVDILQVEVLRNSAVVEFYLLALTSNVILSDPAVK